MNEAPICPNCQKPTRLIDSKSLYGTSHGLMYRCHPCDTHVGVHKGTTKPLGTPADLELRNLRRELHKAFDQIWQRREFETTRSQAYRWLSKRVGVKKRDCHIGHFDQEQCIAALRAVYSEYPKTNRLKTDHDFTLR